MKKSEFVMQIGYAARQLSWESGDTHDRSLAKAMAIARKQGLVRTPDRRRPETNRVVQGIIWLSREAHGLNGSTEPEVALVTPMHYIERAWEYFDGESRKNLAPLKVLEFQKELSKQ